MVVEISLILTLDFGPEWNRRIEVLFCKAHELLDFISVGTIKKLPKTGVNGRLSLY